MDIACSIRIGDRARGHRHADAVAVMLKSELVAAASRPLSFTGENDPATLQISIDSIEGGDRFKRMFHPWLGDGSPTLCLSYKFTDFHGRKQDQVIIEKSIRFLSLLGGSELSQMCHQAAKAARTIAFEARL